MTRSFALGALVAGALVALPAGAQQAPACALDFSNPPQLELGRSRIAAAEQATKPEDRARLVKDAMRFIGDKKIDPASPARAYLLGYAASLVIPAVGQPAMLPTDAVGWPLAAPGSQFDPIAAMDSLYTAVAKALPGCKGQMDGARQNGAWVDRVKAAFRQLQESKDDSAKATALESLRFYANAPYAHEVLQAVAQNKGQLEEQLTHIGHILEIVPASDTTFADLRRRMLWTQASQLSDASDAEADPARKKALGARSIAAFIALIEQAPDYELTPYAVANGGAATALAQDTVNARKLIAPLLASPDRYAELALEKGAALASEMGDRPQAIALYKAQLARNPHHPISWYNLGVLYYQEKQPHEMLGLTARLIALDPNNPSAVDLNAFAYDMLRDSVSKARPPAKAPGQPNPALGAWKVKLDAYTDSSAQAGKQSRAITMRVGLGAFSRLPRKTTLQGEVENLGAAARPVTLVVEFLDEKGAVVESKTQELGSVAAKKTVPFSIGVDKGGIAGIRYVVK